MSLKSTTVSGRSSTASRDKHTLKDEWEEANMNHSRVPRTSRYRMKSASASTSNLSKSSLHSILKNPICTNGSIEGSGSSVGGSSAYKNDSGFLPVKTGFVCLNELCTGEQLFDENDIPRHQRWFPTHTMFKKVEYQEPPETGRPNTSRPRRGLKPPTPGPVRFSDNRYQDKKKVNFRNNGISNSVTSSKPSVEGERSSPSSSGAPKALHQKVPSDPMNNSKRLRFMTSPPSRSAASLQSQMEAQHCHPRLSKPQHSKHAEEQLRFQTPQQVKVQHTDTQTTTTKDITHPILSKTSSVDAPAAKPIKDTKVVHPRGPILCSFCDAAFLDQPTTLHHMREFHYSSMMLELSFNAKKYIDRDEGGGVSLYATSE